MVNTIQTSKYLSYFLTILFLCSVEFLWAQAKVEHICGSDILLKKERETPSQQIRILDFNEKVRLMSSQLKGNRSSDFTIPVVVHIIHSGGPENISDAQVIQAIADLNSAFSNSGNFEDPQGVNTGIVFCLAKQDENGQFTTGINRIQSTLTNMIMESQDQELKNLIQWNPNHYLNIWLVNSISSVSMGPNVAGYATLPSSHGFPNDGIVNEAGLFGSSPSNSKVHIHEAGHYCGLYHTFEGGCINSNCQTDNDQVCDTPPDASVSPVNCGAVINTCTTDEDDISLNNPFRPIVNGGLGDQNDLYINYMDYGFQTCQTLFTDGQRVRMLTSLQQIRNTLLDSHGCLSPCTNPLTASFSFTPPEPIQVGTSVQFTSQSTGGVTNWEWFSNNVSFSTSNNPTHSFNQDGTFYIELNVSNGDPACTISILDTIHVTCPIQASFSASDQEVAPGSTVLFTNTGSGYNSVQWFINGVPDAITTDLSHTFDTEGQYMITQISSNDLCEMVANTIIIQVGNSCDSVSAGNDLVICAGDAVQLHGTSPGINNVVSTEWIGGTGQFIPNAQDPNAIYYPSSQEISTGIANLQFKLTFGSSTAGVDASLLAYDHSGEDSIYYISPNTGAIQGIQSNSGHDLTAIGYQFSTHLLYGMSNIVDLPNLYQIDVQTNEVTLILPNLFYDYWAGDFDNTHQLFYAVATANGSAQDQVLHKFDMSSGTPINTTIGSLGIVGDNDNNFFNNGFGINGLAYDPSLNRLYGVAFLGYLYNIDINTGLATLIGNTQTMLRGLAYDFGTNKLWGCDVNSNLYEIDKNTGNVIDTVMCQGNFVVTTSLTYAPGILQNQQVTCYDSVQIIIHPSPFVDLGPDSAFCSNQQNILHAGTGLTSYEWQDGSSDSTYTVNAVGQYDVLVTNSWGCTDRDTIVFSNPQPLATNLNLGSDTVLCDGGVWVLQGPTGFPLTTWSDLSHGQNLTIYGPGTYWITVKDACGTLASDTVHVDAADTPVLDLGGDTIACISNQFQLHAGQGFATYLWNTTAQTESVIIDTTGTYWVKAKSDDGCWAYDTVDVQINLPFDPVVLGEDTTICTANFIRIQAPSGFESYSWNTGVQTDFIEVNSAGNYWVEVLDSSHCFSVDSIQVFFANVPSEFVIPNAFSPNGDAINDYFAWDQHYITDFQLSVFNRWGMKLYETNQVDHFWDGDNQADGTYYFIVHYTELCTNEPVEKKGFFSLLH